MTQSNNNPYNRNQQVAPNNPNVPTVNPSGVPGQTIQGAQRNRANEGLTNANANRGRLGNRDVPSGLKDNQEAAAKNLQTAKQVAKQEMAKNAVKKLGKSVGIPEKVTEKALKTPKGRKLLNNVIKAKKDESKDSKNIVNKVASHMPGVIGLAGKAASKAQEKKDEKTQKEEEELKDQGGGGDFNFQMSLKTIKKVVLIAPLAFGLISFVAIFASLIADEKSSSSVVGEMSSKDKNALTSARSELGNGVGGSIDEFPSEFRERFANLGNSFTSDFECSGEACYNRPEFRYYLKIADIATRYRNKYNVTLDWFYITTANLYFSDTSEVRMKKNIGGYNESEVDNNSITTSLDWDYDYKNIEGYQYLDANDSSYDLQILAKNMVKKKTIQTCTDSNGSTIATQEDEDVEDVYFQEGGAKRLSCSGNYSINSTYTVDTEKFEEFLLEYIDKKMLSEGSKNGSPSSNNKCEVSSDKFIWPVGSKDTTKKDDGNTYALGEPVSTQITSYFGAQESFRTSGHGAIDISSNGEDAGKVNVIASRDGEVVYPVSKSQTSYADNGYINNPDGGGYGNYIIIKHDNGLYTLYGHLAKDSITVMSGDKVKQGQVIGKIGNSGSSTGTHLHFEMRKDGNTSSNRVDPLGYVNPSDPRLGINSSSCTGGSSLASALVNLAVSQINDPAAVNGQKYWSYLGFSYRIEWCAAFVSWTVNNAEYNGQKLGDKIPFKHAAVSEWMNYFYKTDGIDFKYNDNCSTYAGKNGTDAKYTPKAGDIIFFDWGQDWNGAMPVGWADHIGIVQRVENGRIITIEGNSSNSVKESSYPLNSCNVVAFGSWY